jgi:hypothetical protein
MAGGDDGEHCESGPRFVDLVSDLGDVKHGKHDGDIDGSDCQPSLLADPHPDSQWDGHGDGKPDRAWRFDVDPEDLYFLA